MSVGHVVCGNENCGGIMLNIWHNCSPGYAFMLRDYFLWLLAIDQAPPPPHTAPPSPPPPATTANGQA